MIPQAAITEWGRTVPWPTVEQIEQDLLLSRLIVEIADDDYLGDELVFRGGTCLHKYTSSMHLNHSATARTSTTSAAPAAGFENSPGR